MGQRDPELGQLAGLPPAWWYVFPAVRRHGKRATASEQVHAEQQEQAQHQQQAQQQQSQELHGPGVLRRAPGHGGSRRVRFREERAAATDPS
jgi:hypothetical protein